MSTDFILPDIGEGIVECEVVEWLIKVGDTIAEDQPVADVMTDKALVQIPSMYSGVVDKLYYDKGDIAKVHAPLFSIVQDGDISTSNDTGEAVPAAPAADEVESTNSVKEHVEDFILPDIGEGIIECEVVEWLVAEGDLIKEDQPVCDVMTDKALVQIPSKYNGKVVRLYYDKGDTAIVHKPLFAIEVFGAQGIASLEAKSKSPAAAPAPAAEAPAPAKVAGGEASVPASAAKGKAVASPAVRRLAREMNIDISQVQGSGKKGRVYKEDLTKAQQPAQAPVAAAAPAAQSKPGTRVEKIKGIPLAMARAMSESASTIPHFTYCDEVDMTKLIALRSKLKEKYAKQNIKLTMMPFFMKSISLALNEFPIVNSQPNEDLHRADLL